MITSTNGSMELMIAEPLYFSSCHQPLSHNSIREVQYRYSDPTNGQVKLRNQPNESTISIDSNPFSNSMSNIPLSTNDQSFPVTTIDKSQRCHSPICDEQILQLIPREKHSVQRKKSPSYQATRFARRHFHIYDCTRLSFYDNVPPPLGYLSEPAIIEDCSPTSISSNDEKCRSSNDRKDSGLGTSSIEKHIDSITQSNHVNRPISTSSSSSSSSSSSTTSSNSSRTNPLNRLPTATRRIRVKWHSFTRTHRPSLNSSKYHLGQMSVGQLTALRRAALIRIQELFDTTRILTISKSDSIEKSIPTRHCLLATAFSAVPKLIIRRHQQRKEIPLEKKNAVFGISLLAMTQRTGHPVPITIISAMKYLRRTSIDSLGIFRKPGVSSRIKHLYELIDSDLEFHQFDEFSPYDVSDILKKYFRLLPECLFTTKLSPLFLHINQYFSSSSSTSTSTNQNRVKNINDRRLLPIQYAILLLPDEHRLVLHLLLLFLNDVSKHSKTNQMSSINLATCFAPTLFSFGNTLKISSNGMPDLREIEEQRKAMNILAFMIDHVRYLFLVPEELHQACHFSYIEIGEPCTLDELSRRISEPCINSNNNRKQSKTNDKFHSIRSLSSTSLENLHFNNNNNNNNNNSEQSLKSMKTKSNLSYQTFIDRCIVEVMRESCQTKSKGWISFGKNNQIELAYKKLDDGHPLGLWKCSIEIEAPPIEILNRLLNERHLWDDDFQSGMVIEKLNRNTHVYQYVVNSMVPLASRYFCEVRSWRTNIQLNNTNNNLLSSSSSHTTTQHYSREACVLVCTSIEHPKAHCPVTLVRAVTLASRYLIQPYSCGKSKITHLSRVDLMGRSHEWYTKVYGSILTRSMSKLRDSFLHVNIGPETKV